MILTLEVLGDQAENLGPKVRKVFDSIGGTIGRLPDNDWVFPDPYVSGRHALIRYLNGKFFVEDTSTNGVFINSPDNRLARDQAHQLRTGDLLFIDAYQIQVSIAKPATSGTESADPFAMLKGRGRSTPDKAQVASHEVRTESMVRSGDDQSIEWFGMGETNEPPPRVPAPAPARAARRPVPSPARPVPSAAREAPSVNADADLFEQMLAAAGIEGVERTAELAQTFGTVLRIAVGGLMEALRARERAKDDMRLRGTTFKPAHNNPLKFSANVDDAFHNMLVKHNPAYLSPPEAFDDALRDVRDHQAAIVAATRLAFESTLAQFDPTRMQDEFDRQMKKGSILGVPAKLRYWDLFRDKYGELAKDSENAFRTLFGEEFAKAYEEQLERLQSSGRHRQK